MPAFAVTIPLIQPLVESGDAVIVFAHTHPGVRLPITRPSCPVCHEQVRLLSDDWFPVRVNGDSMYGYEPMHAHH